jgi:raffinose/stachyose/melibiose transport system substrate-binding protein
MKKLIGTVAASAALLSTGLAMAQELTFWSWRVEDKEFYESIAKEYKKATGVDIKYSAYKNTEYPTVISAALASGGGPDIIHTRAYGGLSNLSDAGYLLPVTKETVPNLAKFNESVLAGAYGRKAPHNKNLYGVPFATQSLGIFYNKQFLAKAGVKDLPKTWDEFKAVCKSLKEKKLTCLANGSKEAPMLEQAFGVVGPNFYGGTEFFKGVMSGNKKFTDAAFVKALDEVVALKEFMPPNQMGVGENESRTLFAAEQAAFFMTGTWNIDTIKTMNPKLEFDVMPAPPLAANGPTYVSTFSDGNYSINAKTKNKDAALKFLNYLASREYGQKFTNELRQVSAVPEVQATDPLVSGVIQQTKKNGTPFLMLVGFRYDNPNGSILLRDGLQKVMQGQISTKQLAQDIQTGLAMWHIPFQK